MNSTQVKKGFTLIELLVVVAVIGILASVILVGLASFRGRGRDARRIGDLRQIQNALELYFSANGQYPANLNLSNFTSVGVNQIPVDPTSNNAYSYCVTAPVANRYVVGATLEEDNPALREQAGATFPCSPSGVTCNTANPATTRGYCVTI